LSLQLHPAAILAQRPPTTLMGASSREKPITLRSSSMPQDPTQLNCPIASAPHSKFGWTHKPCLHRCYHKPTANFVKSMDMIGNEFGIPPVLCCLPRGEHHQYSDRLHVSHTPDFERRPDFTFTLNMSQSWNFRLPYDRRRLQGMATASMTCALYASTVGSKESMGG